MRSTCRQTDPCARQSHSIRLAYRRSRCSSPRVPILGHIRQPAKSMRSPCPPIECEGEHHPVAMPIKDLFAEVVQRSPANSAAGRPNECVGQDIPIARDSKDVIRLDAVRKHFAELLRPWLHDVDFSKIPAKCVFENIQGNAIFMSSVAASEGVADNRDELRQARHHPAQTIRQVRIGIALSGRITVTVHLHSVIVIHRGCDTRGLRMQPNGTASGNRRHSAAIAYSEVARPKRFEPLTPRFEVWCSLRRQRPRNPPGTGRAQEIGGRVQARGRRSFHDQLGPKPAIRLSRMDWISAAKRASLFPPRRGP
jgi:hypothetical protein